MVDQKTLDRIADLALKGASTPGIDGWRAEAVCREIASLLNKEIPPRPSVEDFFI